MLMKEESFSRGVTYMLMSATGMAFVGFLGKIGSEVLPLSSLIFWRFFAAFLCALLFLGVFGYLKHGIRLENAKLNFYRSFFTLTAQYSFYYYVQHNSLLNGVVLLNTGPLFIPLIEKAFLQHKIGKSTWVGLIVSFFGVLCILQPNTGIFSLLSMIGLLAGICQGISQVLFGLNARNERGEIGVFLLFGCVMLLSLIPYAFIGHFTLEHDRSTLWVISFILLLGVASVANQMPRAVAYQHGTPSRLAPFFYVSVVIAALLDWIVLGNVPSTLSVIGAFLVVSGGILKIYLRYRILKKPRL